MRVRYETPCAWTEQSEYAWALKTGMLLGAGLATRLGFSLWFVVLLGSFHVSAWHVVGLALALYGVVRGSSAIAISALYARRGAATVGAWLVGARPAATRASALSTVAFGTVSGSPLVIVLVGGPMSS